MSVGSSALSSAHHLARQTPLPTQQRPRNSTSEHKPTVLPSVEWVVFRLHSIPQGIPFIRSVFVVIKLFSYETIKYTFVSHKSELNCDWGIVLLSLITIPVLFCECPVGSGDHY